jgi:Zn-dependent peptidase ImmA (M78 family)
LNIHQELDSENAFHRFVGAFLAPAEIVRFELGSSRTALEMNELYLLKHKYGLSMQAWVYRVKDLEIISPTTSTRLFQRFRANGWHRKEPDDAFSSEKPLRMGRLIYRALAEDLISRSRGQELLGEPLQSRRVIEELLLRPA